MKRNQLSWQERELALRLEIEPKSKPYLTIYHPLQADRPIDLRTRYCRLVELGIARVETGKYGAVLLGRGWAWDTFVKSPEGEVLRNREFVQAREILGWLRQQLSVQKSVCGVVKPVIKIRRAVVSTSPTGSAKVIPLRPAGQTLKDA